MTEIEAVELTASGSHDLSDEKRYERLDKFWTEMRSVQARSQETLDRSLLTLSSAALGLSLAFAQDVVGGAPEHTWAVVTSWLCFIMCILATLLSFMTTQEAAEVRLEQADGFYLRDEGDALDGEALSLMLLRYLNWVSLGGPWTPPGYLTHEVSTKPGQLQSLSSFGSGATLHRFERPRASVRWVRERNAFDWHDGRNGLGIT